VDSVPYVMCVDFMDSRMSVIIRPCGTGRVV
jgi:hypothetical protein